MLKDIIAILVLLIICLAAGAIGSLFTIQSIPTWYASAAKPVFTPPNWLFGPAWTLLYILMAIAAFLVWKKGFDKPAVRFALLIFGAQLALNTIWTPLFFGLHQLLLAFIEIVVLWLFILWTMVKFFPISSAAGWLLVPYILWVSFASVLNFAFWIMN